jgi:hypothetical protein
MKPFVLALSLVLMQGSALAQGGSESSPASAVAAPITQPMPEPDAPLAPGPEAGIPIAQEASGTPSWVAPVAVLGTAAIICAIVCTGGHSSTATTPNTGGK